MLDIVKIIVIIFVFSKLSTLTFYKRKNDSVI